MRKFLIITLITLACTSCSTINNMSGSPRIPNRMLNCTLGDMQLKVIHKMYNYYYESYSTIPDFIYVTKLIGNKKVEHALNYDGISFGSFHWQHFTCYFDYRDRLFCTAFTHEYSQRASAISRYEEVKTILDNKYGPGSITSYGIVYGNPTTRSMHLGVVKNDKESRWACVLLYYDERIYQSDTAKAINEF